MNTLQTSIPDGTASFLLSLPLFAGTAPAALQAALGAAHLRAYAAGEEADVSRNDLCVLLSGGAHILSSDSDRTVILRTLCPGDVFGAAALFCAEEEPISRIAALSPASCLHLPRAAVQALLQSDASFLSHYVAFLANRVAFLNRKIRSFTAGSAARRLSLWLCSEEHDVVTLPASLSDFSDMLDIGRASLYRALDALAAQGLITRDGRTIHILKRDQLAHITQ